MKLYLVQTGEAQPRETTDFERPLTTQGRRNIEKMASLLSGAHMQAKKVVHSGAVRARQTLEILQWAAAPSRPGPEARNGLGPEDPVEPWVGEIDRWTEDAIVVCHHPFIGRLASRLVTGNENSDVFSFTPGTALCLERGASGWRVCWMVPPGAAVGLG
ncbi:MAG: phosphohistidine phosphatase SixA [Deltaproteobacteria bacterium]|nr:phosphohistidine phosphatase SixA [Deltaproteobacteria bacterium]